MDVEEFMARWTAGEEMLVLLMQIFKVTVLANGQPINTIHVQREDLVEQFREHSDIFLVEAVPVVRVRTQTDGGSVFAFIQTLSMKDTIPVQDALLDPALGGDITAATFIDAVRVLMTNQPKPDEPL